MGTQVCISGGGPSGLVLAQMRHRAGIGAVVLERCDRDCILSRIRAGVREGGIIQNLRDTEAGAVMDADGHPRTGTHRSTRNRTFRVDYNALTGKPVIVDGRTKMTADLHAVSDAVGGRTDALKSPVARRRRAPCRGARGGQEQHSRRLRRPLTLPRPHRPRRERHAGVARHSERALACVWKATRFSWWSITRAHRFPREDATFRPRIQEAGTDRPEPSVAAQTAMAENYMGFPF